jgi:hypothetical protein
MASFQLSHLEKASTRMAHWAKEHWEQWAADPSLSTIVQDEILPVVRSALSAFPVAGGKAVDEQCPWCQKEVTASKLSSFPWIEALKEGECVDGHNFPRCSLTLSPVSCEPCWQCAGCRRQRAVAPAEIGQVGGYGGRGWGGGDKDDGW